MKNESSAHMALIRHKLICSATDTAHFLNIRLKLKAGST